MTDKDERALVSTPPSSSNTTFICQSLLAGGIAGTVAKTVVAPMDRVKIHFQVRSPHYAPFIGQITGVFQAITETYKRQGFWGLYRGHAATVLRVFPYAGINFMAYEQFKRILYRNTDRHNVPAWRRILAGSLAGCTAVTATYPFDLLRARVAFIVSEGTNKSGVYPEAIQRLLMEGRSAYKSGILGFYQGYVPTIFGIIPYAGTSFFTFESLKGWYMERHGTTDIPPLNRLAFGMAAGACAQTITYPLDIVRRRSQLWRVSTHLPPTETLNPKDTWLVMRSIAASGGLRDLFVGLSINYFKVVPSMGISFFIYDTLKKHFYV